MVAEDWNKLCLDLLKEVQQMILKEAHQLAQSDDPDAVLATLKSTDATIASVQAVLAAYQWDWASFAAHLRSSSPLTRLDRRIAADIVEGKLKRPKHRIHDKGSLSRWVEMTRMIDNNIPATVIAKRFRVTPNTVYASVRHYKKLREQHSEFFEACDAFHALCARAGDEALRNKK
jgi:hypothetical protein